MDLAAAAAGSALIIFPLGIWVGYCGATGFPVRVGLVIGSNVGNASNGWRANEKRLRSRFYGDRRKH
jgi:hypothetical protein